MGLVLEGETAAWLTVRNSDKAHRARYRGDILSVYFTYSGQPEKTVSTLDTGYLTGLWVTNEKAKITIWLVYMTEF